MGATPPCLALPRGGGWRAFYGANPTRSFSGPQTTPPPSARGGSKAQACQETGLTLHNKFPHPKFCRAKCCSNEPPPPFRGGRGFMARASTRGCGGGGGGGVTPAFPVISELSSYLTDGSSGCCIAVVCDVPLHNRCPFACSVDCPQASVRLIFVTERYLWSERPLTSQISFCALC